MEPESSHQRPKQRKRKQSVENTDIQSDFTEEIENQAKNKKKRREKTALKIKDESSNSEASDSDDCLNFKDETQFFPVGAKRQQIKTCRNGVPKLLEITKTFLLNHSHSHLLLEEIPTSFLDQIGYLSKANPIHMYKINEGRSEKDRQVTEKYWKHFCDQDFSYRGSPKNGSYQERYKSCSQYYRKEAKKVEKTLERQNKKLRKKVTPEPVPVWMRQISDHNEEDNGDMFDSEEEKDYPTDPSDDDD